MLEICDKKTERTENNYGAERRNQRRCWKLKQRKSGKWKMNENNAYLIDKSFILICTWLEEITNNNE